jgi:hypothetical protein
VAPTFDARIKRNSSAVPFGSGDGAWRGPREQRHDQKQEVEQGEAHGQPLPARIAASTGAQGDERDGASDGDWGGNAEKSHPDANCDNLGNEGDEVCHDEIASRQPTLERSETLENQFPIPSMGHRAEPHRHFLNDVSRNEGDCNEGQKEA